MPLLGLFLYILLLSSETTSGNNRGIQCCFFLFVQQHVFRLNLSHAITALVHSRKLLVAQDAVGG